jgi:excisionase family DNA binding protein
VASASQTKDELLTPEQAASILKVTRRYVMRELAQKGKIPRVRLGGGNRYRFWLSDVLRLAREWTEESKRKSKRPKKKPR